MGTIIRKDNNLIIKEAREAFKGQWGNVFFTLLGSSILYIVLVLLSLLVSLLPALLALILVEISGKLGYIIMILCIPLALIGWAFVVLWLIMVLTFRGRFWIWQSKYILRKARGEQISISDIKSIFDSFRSINEIKSSLFKKQQLIKNLLPAITLFLSTVSILLGNVLLIIPGIILSLMLAFVPFIAAEENEIYPIEVMKKSIKLMDGYKMKLFWCYVKLIPLFILCLLPFGLGLLWFMPYMSFVLAKFYDEHK